LTVALDQETAMVQRCDKTIGGRIGAFVRPALLVGALALSFPSFNAVAGVSYTATDLADVSAGQDLWRYTYRVNGPLPAFGAFNLLFSSSNYGNLSVGAFSTGLSPLLAQPDPGLGSDGMLTLTTFSGLLAGNIESVELDFVWLGTGMPADQAYEVLDDAFNVIGTAKTSLLTTPPQGVPEPGVLSLITLGLLSLPVLRRRRSATAL
jgi:hypothetical protein